MPRLPKPPAAVPVESRMDGLAPKFRAALERMLAELRERGHDALVFETLRTNARQAYLYGFGRDYDDGRGVVTKAATAMGGWHFYGLAADVVHRTQLWGAPEAFWTALRLAARRNGLTSGDDWDRDGLPVELDPDEHVVDRPHVQWWCPGMRVSPSAQARALYEQGGREAVWRAVHADA